MIKNSNKFREAALRYQTMGFFTSAPSGTTAYTEYWDEEVKRCLEGFQADDGDWISGYNYFYLNFCPILLVKESTVNIRGEATIIQTRTREFPDFWDTDYEFFNAVERAEREGKHLVVLKARGKGYSFKCASMLCRNFYLIRESTSYAIAAENEFLTKDGILTKAFDYIDWIDQHTAWTKKRQKIDTKMHKRASLVVDEMGAKIEIGYKSEIIGITLKNDVQKARGKRGKLVLWEEAGKFPNLKEAWQIARPSVEQDGIAYGTMIAFGTGGTEEGDYESLEDLFYEPKAYNCLSFDNIWDEGASRKCGFFVPEYMNMKQTKDGEPLMDIEGNSFVAKAKAYSLKERQLVFDNASDKNAIDRYVAEHPFTPAEACLRISGNIFPKVELSKHLTYIQTHESVRSFKQVGDLYFDNTGAIKWDQQKKLQDITSYRINPGDDTRGAVVIWEHPMTDPPYGLYIMAVDPYRHDKSSSSGSLGSCLVYKRFFAFEKNYDLVVAEYTARPDTLEEFYENVRKLALYYKATILYENEVKGLYQHFEHKNCAYLIADQPGIIKDIIKDSKVERGKGIHMVTGIKDWAELKLKDWLCEEYEPGKQNLTKILSEPLLEELIAYNDEGNFDRVIAFMLIMIYNAELHRVHVKRKEDTIRKNGLFDEPIFKEYNYDVVYV
jgi:hypothetical protein